MPSNSTGRSPAASLAREWCEGGSCVEAGQLQGSHLSFQSVHLQAFYNKKIIWLLFLWLQQLPYLLCSSTFIKNPLMFNTQLRLHSTSPCLGSLNSLLTLARTLSCVGLLAPSTCQQYPPPPVPLDSLFPVTVFLECLPSPPQFLYQFIFLVPWFPGKFFSPSYIHLYHAFSLQP